ncbi:hypothetical protein ACFLTK_03690 [Chloroflexota bacterium]
MGYEVRNWVKVRVLLYLSEINKVTEPSELGRGFGEKHTWASVPDIARFTGAGVDSLRVLLGRWERAPWGYVDGRHFSSITMNDSRHHWMYKINGTGISYFNRLDRWYPRLQEAKDYLEKLWEEECGGDLSVLIRIRGIAWHVRPAEWATVIEWPFATSRDAHESMVWGENFKVDNMDMAISTARSIFGIVPSRECLQYAQALEKYHVKEALEKLRQKTGV